jgi:hypothetical protein
MTGERHIGKPCKLGHVERYADGKCAECERLRTRKRRADPAFTLRENIAAKAGMAKLRADPNYREQERAADRERIAMLRAERM